MQSAREIWEAFEALPEERRWAALAIAGRELLAIWTAWHGRNGSFEYRDSVVWMRHQLDFALPGRALAEIDARVAGQPVDPTTTFRDYSEPIVALHDEDLELEDQLELVYYAIYNLHRVVFARPPQTDEETVLTQYLEALDRGHGREHGRGHGDDALLREWWTRVWDTWATTATP